jgi:hypothetical protein
MSKKLEFQRRMKLGHWDLPGATKTGSAMFEKPSFDFGQI